MNSGNLAVMALLGIAAASVAGCEPEGEAQDPSFPEPIGYTPPSVAPTPAAALPAPAPQPMAEGDAVEDAPYDDADPSALTDFRGALDPYGSWTEDPTYGTVWVPSESVVGSDFTPYVSAGHWTYDDDDYAWASDYDWGWAPFHYGRWAYADGPGWEWIPGRRYAGAWVSWRVGAEGYGYVGWAPLSPTWGWRGGTAVGLGFVPRAPYAFVGSANLFSPSVGAHVLAGPQVGGVAAHTTPYVPSGSASSGHVLAHPTVGGPMPDSIHIASSAVVHASPVDAHGLAQARAYSRPGTATALGARAPLGYWGRAYVARSSAPYESSHFGGRLLGGGFSGNAASARPMATPYYGGRSGGAARPYYGSPSQGAPVSRGYSAPRGYASPSGYGGHSGGAGSFRGSSGSSGFHGGGGGGGASHGGGGGHGGGHR